MRIRSQQLADALRDLQSALQTRIKKQDILDPCCGSRMFYFDKADSRVLFGDNRELETTLCDGRTLKVAPDMLMDFTRLPFEDERFHMVVFDPPHLATAGDSSWLVAKYGKLSDNWQYDLRQGFSECFRVLKKNGTLIFKWNETQIPVKEILKLCEIKPVFGNKQPKQTGTHWIVFMKP